MVERALAQLDVKWQAPREEVFGRVMEFFAERLAFYLETAKGLGFDTVRAVLAAGWEVPCDALRRAEALEAIRGSEDFKALSAAAKRIKNILSKSAEEADWTPGEVSLELLRDEPERRLFEEFSAARAETKSFADALWSSEPAVCCCHPFVLGLDFPIDCEGFPDDDSAKESRTSGSTEPRESAAVSYQASVARGR